MKRERFAYILWFLLSFSQGFATEYQPWLGNWYEFECRSSLLYQEYPKLSTGDGTIKRDEQDLFLNVSLANARPDPDMGFELEFRQAGTWKQKGDLDQIKFTSRLVLRDDVAGDPLSVTIGLSYTQAFKHSLQDVSSFHHGYYEGEGFISIGQEKADETIWESRWWSLFSLGVAERGSPWCRVWLNYEKRFLEKHEVQVSCRSLWGFGNRSLCEKKFNGYGSVHHQSIDLGLRYTYLLEFYGSLSIEYAYRVYGKNFPVQTNCVFVQYLATFGL